MHARFGASLRVMVGIDAEDLGSAKDAGSMTTTPSSRHIGTERRSAAPEGV